MFKITQRQTAEELVGSFNRMDIDAIMSCHSQYCMRHILPSTLGHSPSKNEEYEQQLRKLTPIFNNFSLTINDLLEDREARRICMWLKARADTMAGEYVNEYMWMLDLDESGVKITKINELVDTVMNRDFWLKLQSAKILVEDRVSLPK